MVTPKQVREFYGNFQAVLDGHDRTLEEMEWSTWFRLPQTQAFLDLIMLREMAAQCFMAECNDKSSEFVKTFSRFQGNYEALNDLSSILADFKKDDLEKKEATQIEEGS